MKFKRIIASILCAAIITGCCSTSVFATRAYFGYKGTNGNYSAEAELTIGTTHSTGITRYRSGSGLVGSVLKQTVDVTGYFGGIATSSGEKTGSGTATVTATAASAYGHTCSGAVSHHSQTISGGRTYFKTMS